MKIIMKKVLLIITFIECLNVQGENNKKLSDYFPLLQNKDTIINSTIFIHRFYGNKNVLPDSIALKYFFDNKIENMQGESEGYNVDDNTYIYSSYTKKVCPLYKITNENTCLLCYGIDNMVYLCIYDITANKIEDTFTVVDDSDDFGNYYTRSTVFKNNYIATIQFYDHLYYILYKIDYETKKFVELKKIEKNPTDLNDYIIKNNLLESLGISETGELLGDEDNENNKDNP
jgi:hypothetical protein